MNLRDNAQSLRGPNSMKITFQVKGFTSMSHDNLVQKFIPMPQAMKIPDAQAAVEKKWKISRQCQHGI